MATPTPRPSFLKYVAFVFFEVHEVHEFNQEFGEEGNLSIDIGFSKLSERQSRQHVKTAVIFTTCNAWSMAGSPVETKKLEPASLLSLSSDPAVFSSGTILPATKSSTLITLARSMSKLWTS